MSSIWIWLILADSGLIIKFWPNWIWPFPETFPSIFESVPGSLTLIAKSENCCFVLVAVFVVGSTSNRVAAGTVAEVVCLVSA
ncbi:hypothetical protein RNM28_02750 [Mesomycoplasma ovipneumoniae]|uniref:hypothetical protein n=1 Tax=Mesomycoplasma ovipneumoniae TaxID=29562 RepID=UPI0028A91C33|nr:hypothetical protein [Mesomycoplasma ovipneumoniae]WNM17062.1 hypothetical protein RNM28_02750 [Mesomycoplasma ovipneumoniae]